MDDSALSPQQDTQRVHIYDHPESRIAFLETALAGEQWRATLYASALEPGQNLSAIHEALSKHGYRVERGQDKYGNPVLNILHLPSEAGLMESIQVLGLGQGIQHTLSNMTASKLFGTVKHGAQYIINDKAHILSAFYLLGDSLLILSGIDNKELGGTAKRGFAERLKTLKRPENAMQSLSGVATLMNSMILMVYAQEGNSKDYKQMKEQFYKAMIHGKDPTHPEEWEAAPQSHTMLGKANGWLQDHAIAASASSQIVSQLLIMGSGGIRMSHTKQQMMGATPDKQAELERNLRGSKKDMGRGVASILGWLGMMYPAHKVEDKAPWYHPMRAVHEFQEHPERFASVLTGGASAVGIMGGRDKSNVSQMLGEASLILGDVTIFFTDVNEYGAGKATTETVAKTAAKFINETPLLLDEAQQAAFVQRLSYYLAGKRAAQDVNINPSQEAELLAGHISKALEALPSRLGEAADEMTRLVSALPGTQRLSATRAISQVLTQMPGVYVSSEHLEQEVSRRMQILPATTGTVQTMQQMAPHLARLVSHLPVMSVPQNAMRLYDVLTQFVATSPRDKLHINHALKQEIQAQTGLSPHALTQAEQLAQPAPRQLH